MGRSSTAAMLLTLLVGGCLAIDEVNPSAVDGGSADAGPEGGVWPCTVGRADCDGKTSNGCEVDTLTDPTSCGACGQNCASAPNAEPSCAGGQCTFTCAALAGDCDGDPANGCEMATADDVLNCGTCKHSCGTTNTSSSVCQSGKCVIACTAAWGNCDGDDSNGCETSLGDQKNCGSCGRDCKDTQCDTGQCAPTQMTNDAKGTTALGVKSGVLYLAREYSKFNPITSTTSTVQDIVSIGSPGANPSVLDKKTGGVKALVPAPSGSLYLFAAGCLLELPSGASAAQSIACAGSKNTPGAVAVDATSVYWTVSGAVYARPFSGGTTTTLISTGASPNSLAAESGTAFYFDGSHIARVGPGSTTPKFLADETSVAQLSVGGGWVSWAVPSGVVRRVSITGGAVEDFATNQGTLSLLLGDATELFWWGAASAKVMKKPLSGGKEQLFVQNGSTANGILWGLDGTHLYWMRIGDKSVYRLSR